jgi:hypothetical protein
MSLRHWKGAVRDRTDRFKGFKDIKLSTKSSGGSTHDNSRELRFKPLTSSIMKIVNDDDLEVEQPMHKNHLNEHEITMNSDEPSLADDEGIDVRDRKLEQDLSSKYQIPFWVNCKDEIDDNMKRIEVKCKNRSIMTKNEQI